MAKDDKDPKRIEDEEELPGYRMPGRPPRDPKNKVGIPIRCLITIGVSVALDKGMNLHGIGLSDYLRIALYEKLERDGLMTDKLRKDATWDTLRGQGLV